jgi:hypothetical protein
VCQQGTRLTNNILKLKITAKKSSLESVRQIIEAGKISQKYFWLQAEWQEFYSRKTKGQLSGSS